MSITFAVSQRCHMDTKMYAAGLLPLVDRLRKRKVQFMGSCLIKKRRRKVCFFDVALSSRSTFFSISNKSYVWFGIAGSLNGQNIAKGVRDHFEKVAVWCEERLCSIAYDLLVQPGHVCSKILGGLF